VRARYTIGPGIVAGIGAYGLLERARALARSVYNLLLSTADYLWAEGLYPI
jgi:hypothetical protein